MIQTRVACVEGARTYKQATKLLINNFILLVQFVLTSVTLRCSNETSYNVYYYIDIHNPFKNNWSFWKQSWYDLKEDHGLFLSFDKVFFVELREFVCDKKVVASMTNI